MTLGTNLKNDLTKTYDWDDLLVGVLPEGQHKSREQFAADMVKSLDNYVKGALYDDGAVTVVSTFKSSDFLLPMTGTIASAADKIARGVENYWTSAVVGVGIPSHGGDSVVPESGVVLFPTVYSLLRSSLITIFTDISKDTTYTTKVASITSAVESAVTTITTAHSEKAGNIVTAYTGVIS